MADIDPRANAVGETGFWAPSLSLTETGAAVVIKVGVVGEDIEPLHNFKPESVGLRYDFTNGNVSAITIGFKFAISNDGMSAMKYLPVVANSLYPATLTIPVTSNSEDEAWVSPIVALLAGGSVAHPINFSGVYGIRAYIGAITGTTQAGDYICVTIGGPEAYRSYP
jgi:hypothetical protein